MITRENLAEFYFQKFTSREKRLVGKESEYPLVYLDKERYGSAVLAEDTEKLFVALIERGASPVIDDITGHLIAVKANIDGNPVDIGTDFGACTLEIGFAPMRTLTALADHYEAVKKPVVEAADSLGIGILGYGVQPLTPPGRKLLARKGRGKTLESRFDTTRYLNGENTDVHHHTINASEQIHVDLSREEALKAMHAVNRVSPLLIALHANSPIWKCTVGEYQDIRELFWDFVVAIPQDEDRKGISPKFKSEEEYLEKIIGFEPILTLRIDTEGHKRFLEFAEHKTFADFVRKGKSRVIKPGTRKKPEIVPGYETIELTPLDVYVLDGTIWWNARLKSMEGAIEVRMMAQQPPEAQIAPAALIYGLIHNLDALVEFAETQENVAFKRTEACYYGLGTLELRVDAAKLVRIAAEGLRTAEENTSLLDIYEERISTKRTPSNEIIDAYRKSGVQGLIRRSLII